MEHPGEDDEKGKRGAASEQQGCPKDNTSDELFFLVEQSGRDEQPDLIEDKRKTDSEADEQG